MKELFNIMMTYKHIDKVKHFFVGMVIFFVLRMIYNLNCSLSMMMVIVIGLMKEVYDEMFGTTGLDIHDWLVTIIGGLVGFGIYLTILL